MTKIKHFFSRIGRAVRNFFVSDADRESGLLQSVRKPATQTILASVACALMGIIIGFIILLCINPAHAGKGIFAILKNFLNYKRPELRLKYFGNTLVMAAPLIMCSLSVLFAYKAGLFNIGAAGQYCVGDGCCAVCGACMAVALDSLPLARDCRRGPLGGTIRRAQSLLQYQ